MEKINVTAVSYLNTRPFLYGIEQSPIINEVNLSREIPSVVADNLIRGISSVGLVPVAVLQEIRNAHIISDYGICSDGEVASVCIYSQVPIEEAESISLDYQSRTSVELVKILLRDFWKVNPLIQRSVAGYESKIEGTAAGLIIGDRSLQLKKNFRYCYDLGKAWKDHTGLPFVFACWVANRTLPASFITSFNGALKKGVESIGIVAAQNQFFYPDIDTLDYLSNKIQYHLTSEMKKGMETFLTEIGATEKVVPHQA